MIGMVCGRLDPIRGTIEYRVLRKEREKKDGTELCVSAGWLGGCSPIKIVRMQVQSLPRGKNVRNQQPTSISQLELSTNLALTRWLWSNGAQCSSMLLAFHHPCRSSSQMCVDRRRDNSSR